MSRETLTDLNTNTLIGNTDARGHAWHYRAEIVALVTGVAALLSIKAPLDVVIAAAISA